MTTNLQRVDLFNKRLREATKDLTQTQLVLFHKKIALEAFTRIVLKTPVKTGRARSAWQISIGTIPQGNDGGTFQPGGGGDGISVGIAALAGLPPYEIVYIANTLPYIEVLERGRVEDSNGVLRGSEQAPHGMVAVTLAELQTIFGG